MENQKRDFESEKVGLGLAPKMVFEVFDYGEMRRDPNLPHRVDDQKVMAVLQYNVFIEAIQSKESITVLVLTNYRKEFPCREWMACTHNPLESPICNLFLVFTHSIIYLIVCLFEILRKLS
jgi:hypothetical protein